MKITTKLANILFVFVLSKFNGYYFAYLFFFFYVRFVTDMCYTLDGTLEKKLIILINKMDTVNKTDEKVVDTNGTVDVVTTKGKIVSTSSTTKLYDVLYPDLVESIATYLDFWRLFEWRHVRKKGENYHPNKWKKVWNNPLPFVDRYFHSTYLKRMIKTQNQMDQQFQKVAINQDERYLRYQMSDALVYKCCISPFFKSVIFETIAASFKKKVQGQVQQLSYNSKELPMTVQEWIDSRKAQISQSDLKYTNVENRSEGYFMDLRLIEPKKVDPPKKLESKEVKSEQADKNEEEEEEEEEEKVDLKWLQKPDLFDVSNQERVRYLTEQLIAEECWFAENVDTFADDDEKAFHLIPVQGRLHITFDSRLWFRCPPVCVCHLSPFPTYIKKKGYVCM
ncbi:hypothetical protein RFI_27868 [Reticulomyxa filosa]|uniref:Uncharacterized protein n=1 Tax=Reticulomyxa filosa TaxID=46433 RepID=X6M6H7_RETFI|nr:hypothetical protein RFI_27868 [Reticulomyxa filosa]|eukprot:ETO09509.1 hypothetical protein RFI_27868 [Reticulomyxa filosa]